MLNQIIAFSLRRRPIILFLSILLLAVGTWTMSRMEVDVFPDLNAPTVVIMTEAEGMAAEEVERLVTFPIETAVNGATGVRRVRSTSSMGFSIVWVEFEWGTDIYRERQIVSERLATIADRLPDGAGTPTMGPQSSIMGEVMFIGLTADSTDLSTLRTLADWTIRPRLLSTGGVAQVSIIGGDPIEYQIALNPDRMRHYGVTLNEVIGATENMNTNAVGSVLYEHGNEYIVRGMLSTTEVREMEKAVIKTTPQGQPIVLADVAEVRKGVKSPQIGTASISGKPGVLLTVTKQMSVSTNQLTRQLDVTVADLQKSLPADVRINTHLYRQQDFIDSSISNIQKSLIEGGIFVVLVLFIFLMNARTTLVSLITIPLSLLITMIVLKVMGLTLNTMSIGGMAIAIGSLVDDAIVDIENVYKRLRQNARLPEGERQTRLQVIYDASREVRMPILNSTLIIVVSFIPLFFLSGLEGRMLVPLGISFIVSLFASTLVALTLTPVLCSFVLTGRALTGSHAGEPRWVTAMKRGYGQLLHRIMGRSSRFILGGVGVLMLVSFGLFFTLGRSFLPPFNEGAFTINVSTLPGISFDESRRIGEMAEEMIMQVPEVQAVARKTGRAELDEHSLGINSSEMEVPYVLRDRSKEEVMADLRQRLRTLPGVSVEIGQPISHRIDAMMSGTKAGIAIKIFGPDLPQLRTLGLQVKAATQHIEGVEDLNVEQQVESPQLLIRPRRVMLARYGITLSDFSRFVQASLDGVVVSQVHEGSQSFDLKVRVAGHYADGIEAVSNLLIDTADGKKVPLSQVADIQSSSGPNSVSRENAQRKLVVSANVSGRDMRSVVNDMRAAIESKVHLPEGYHVEYGGQFESEAAASRLLAGLSVISVIVILLLLFVQFRSWRQSFVVLLNLPLALIGGILVLVFTQGEISIPAIIGFISLFGMATRGGMLLVDRYNELATHGLSREEIVVRGSLDRLLPICMTALTSALALIPLAVGSDLPGNEIQSPMAQVMLGGLISSTFLNLIVIPLIAPIRVRPQEQTIG